MPLARSLDCNCLTSEKPPAIGSRGIDYAMFGGADGGNANRGLLAVLCQTYVGK